MNKLIALVLAMLMVLSAVPLAFAENETDSNDSDVVLVTGDNNETEATPYETDELNETDLENETETELEDEAEVEKEAGIGPDRPFLWGIERAVERIQLALTFNKAAKAKMGLAHARERLMEVQMMITQKKLDAAKKAELKYNETMSDVEDDVADLSDGEDQDLEVEAELDKAMNMHRTWVMKMAGLKLKFKGLTAEQQQKVKDLLSSMNITAEKFKLAIDAKKEKTMLKIKAKTGMTEDDIKELRDEIKDIVNESVQERKEIRKETRDKIKETIKDKIKEHSQKNQTDDSEDDSADNISDSSENESEN
jgi:hypothetical protein